MDHLLKVAAVVALGTLGLLTPAAANATSQLWTGGNVTVKLSDGVSLEDITARFSHNKHGLMSWRQTPSSAIS